MLSVIMIIGDTKSTKHYIRSTPQPQLNGDDEDL